MQRKYPLVTPRAAAPGLSMFASSKRFVLRKKPAGQLLSKTAHQVEREYTMLRALHTHNVKPSTRAEAKVPIPEPIVLCEDVSVIGTPFYIMEFLDGRIFTDPRMPEVSPETRREWYASHITITRHQDTESNLPVFTQLAVSGPRLGYAGAPLTSGAWSVQLRLKQPLLPAADQVSDRGLASASAGHRHRDRETYG